ncbi:MAG TPA: carboxypeptidase-like regulatory domain-containing protein [Fulvivirga sp.]|nr:carboxypeptidase-like regulatory domain-containing protein [Fulvivirga sp.]
MKYILLVLLLLPALLTKAQEKEIEIVGQIVDPESSEAVSYVHIINTAMKKGVVSNTEGRFWIKMHKKDTLLFSAIGFEKYLFTLKEGLKSDKLIVTIELRHSTLELETVKVFAFKDEYALKRALIAAEVPIETNKKEIHLPGFYYGPRKELKNSAFSSPLTALGNLFSKEVKEDKKLKQFEQEYDVQNFIRSKYNESVVIELTNLPEDKVEDFMNFCKLEDSFVKRASEYELTVVIQQCLVDFEALLEVKDN